MVSTMKKKIEIEEKLRQGRIPSPPRILTANNMAVRDGVASNFLPLLYCLLVGIKKK